MDVETLRLLGLALLVLLLFGAGRGRTRIQLPQRSVREIMDSPEWKEACKVMEIARANDNRLSDSALVDEVKGPAHNG